MEEQEKINKENEEKRKWIVAKINNILFGKSNCPLLIVK